MAPPWRPLSPPSPPCPRTRGPPVPLSGNKAAGAGLNGSGRSLCAGGRGLRSGRGFSRGTRPDWLCPRRCFPRRAEPSRTPRGGRAECYARLCPAGAERGAVPPPRLFAVVGSDPAPPPRGPRCRRAPRMAPRGRKRRAPAAAGQGREGPERLRARHESGPGGGGARVVIEHWWGPDRDRVGAGAGWGRDGTGSGIRSGTGVGLSWGRDWDGTRSIDPPPRPSRPPPARADGCSGAMPRR